VDRWLPGGGSNSQNDIALHLDRRGPSSLVAHTWAMTKEVDAKGYYVLEKHVVVEFVLKDIFDLKLSRVLPNRT
jgi:hypothetical protein